MPDPCVFTPVPAAPAPTLATAAVQSARAAGTTGFDGVVEAVRQTVVAAQVAGAVTALDVRVGDRVQAGQVLARIDARAAEQNTAAGDAQVRAANASLDIAAKDFEPQQQLFGRNYISHAALERAEAQVEAAQAQLAAQRAQAGATRTQSGFFIVRAPYAGIVSEVPLALGDMALPGRALRGSPYTATRMNGMIALAGIIVCNSILRVDFMNLQVREGVPFKQAVVHAAVTRAQPIVLTGLAAMLDAFFLLDDPIFNGLAIALIFGILVSTALTLVVIPLLYFVAYRNRLLGLPHTSPATVPEGETP